METRGVISTCNDLIVSTFEFLLPLLEGYEIQRRQEGLLFNEDLHLL